MLLLSEQNNILLPAIDKEKIAAFTTPFILEAASFSLSNNSMTFDEMFYLQIQGTSMGTLSMSYHEIEPHANIKNKFTL